VGETGRMSVKNWPKCLRAFRILTSAEYTLV
jgi:hypothetical protein